MYVTKKSPISTETNITWTLIAVAYHSDGKTHGSITGELGKATHFQLVHLMYPKPARTFQEWKNGTTVTATAKALEKQPGFEGIFAITGLIIVSGLWMRRRDSILIPSIFVYLSFSSTSGGQLIICTGFISIFEVATALPPCTVFVAWTFMPLTSMFK